MRRVPTNVTRRNFGNFAVHNIPILVIIGMTDLQACMQPLPPRWMRSNNEIFSIAKDGFEYRTVGLYLVYTLCIYRYYATPRVSYQRKQETWL